LSFENIHANKNKGFQWPPVKSPRSLNQPESAVKRGVNQPEVLAEQHSVTSTEQASAGPRPLITIGSVGLEILRFSETGTL
jgi:hypothetical protein